MGFPQFELLLCQDSPEVFLKGDLAVQVFAYAEVPALGFLFWSRACLRPMLGALLRALLQVFPQHRAHLLPLAGIEAEGQGHPFGLKGRLLLHGQFVLNSGTVAVFWCPVLCMYPESDQERTQCHCLFHVNLF
jgi:hypothetical protein